MTRISSRSGRGDEPERKHSHIKHPPLADSAVFRDPRRAANVINQSTEEHAQELMEPLDWDALFSLVGYVQGEKENILFVQLKNRFLSDPLMQSSRRMQLAEEASKAGARDFSLALQKLVTILRQT